MKKQRKAVKIKCNNEEYTITDEQLIKERKQYILIQLIASLLLVLAVVYIVIASLLTISYSTDGIHSEDMPAVLAGIGIILMIIMSTFYIIATIKEIHFYQHLGNSTEYKKQRRAKNLARLKSARMREKEEVQKFVNGIILFDKLRASNQLDSLYLNDEYLETFVQMTKVVSKYYNLDK